MMQPLRVLACFLCLIAGLVAQSREPSVRKDELSVHTVERGSMPLVASASGTLSRIQPPRAALKFEDRNTVCERGRVARLVWGTNPRPLAGKVVGRAPKGDCEVEFLELIPENATAGQPIRGLITVGEIKDVVYFARPSNSQPNSTATIFRLEDSAHARRVKVRYGVTSGPLIQVLEGLTPGDKVIVTDLSRWADATQIRLE